MIHELHGDAGILDRQVTWELERESESYGLRGPQYLPGEQGGKPAPATGWNKQPDAQTNWRDLPAGPELDALVAERVFGMEPWRDEHGQLVPGAWVGPSGECSGCLGLEKAKFSTTWAGMGLVVEAMEARGWMLQLTDEWHSYPRWRAEFMSRQPDPNHWRGSGLLKADTAPLAVCRAALAALERDDG